MSDKIDCDVVIIGAGIVGLVLAAAFIPTSLRVIVIDEKPIEESWSSNHTDLRVSAITRSSQIIFDTIGAWKIMQRLRISPFREMRVWDAQGKGNIHFNSASMGEAELGHIIENSVMKKALLQVIQQHFNVTLHSNEALEKMEVGSQSVSIILTNGKTIKSKLVVGADGALSKVREIAQMDVHSWDYQQTALVTHVTTDLMHEETAWQIFLSTGPLAFLPLIEDDHCSIVWSTTPEEAKRLQMIPEKDFKYELGQAFQFRLGEIKSVVQRIIFPLRMRHAKNYVKPRIALIGDALHTIHPLGGQGMNLGISDAACLADVVQQAFSKNRDIGSFTTLRRYERARKGDNLSMIAAMEFFKQLFISKNTLIKSARNFGLITVDHLPFLKKFFMQRAMG